LSFARPLMNNRTFSFSNPATPPRHHEARLFCAALLAFAPALASAQGLPSANQVYAGPTSGSPSAPSFRALVPADVPASGTLDVIGSTRGSILERGASGWQIVTPGASGLPFVSNGAAADPGYQLLTGSGIASNTVANSNLTNKAANSVLCNNTSSPAAPTDCTIVYLANGGANPFNGLPLDITQTNTTLSIASNDATNNAGLNNYVATIQTHKTGGATTSAVLGLGAYADANNTKVWGLTSYATVMPSTGITGSSLVGAEIGVRDFGAAGQVSTVAMVVAGMGNNLLTSAIQIQSNTGGGGTSAQFANGILFNNSPKSVVTGALISGNSGTATWGVDFGLMAFSGGAFRSPSFTVDGSGNIAGNNITGAIITGTALFDPIIIGGNTAASTLTLRSANAVGTTDAIIFQVGSSGGTEAARILDSGVFKMGSPSFAANSATTPVFGTLPAGIGSAAQAKWFKFQDSAGVISYMPVWQ
jgi:hypothetical protein